MEKRVRVRFAPSPTGPLHIGGVRTALYNYLFARKHKGDFILRIEDTDSQRFVKGAEEYIIRSLEWCGIKFNEGVSVGGPHAPYRQSERKDIYLPYALELIDKGFAYYAFDTPEELELLRKKAENNKQTFTYNYQVRHLLKNSLNPVYSNYQELIKKGMKWVIRFKMPENVEIKMFDLIRNEITVNSSTLDDKVLYKSSDGLPTYHLANIVDDYLMQISHVIRGEEWLPSLPLHIMLYKAFGWEDEMPKFAHLPLLLKPDGKGKLSKRDGDRLGFPVFPLHWIDPHTNEVCKGYDDFGFIPEAFVNFLALLGWNPGNEQEIFTINELVETFSLEKVNKAGAKFDFEKACWFNHQYIRKTDVKTLSQLCKKHMPQQYDINDDNYFYRIVDLIKERLVLLTDFWQQASFFFVDPEQYDQEIIKKRWKKPIPELLKNLAEVLQNEQNFTAEHVKKVVQELTINFQTNTGAVMNCLRLSLVGGAYGPDLFAIIELIGKDACIRRILKALDKISAEFNT